MKTSKAILGIVGGITAGAVLGILFAPDKGTTTRKKISKKVSKKSGEIKGNLNEILSKVEDKFKNISTKTNNVIDDASYNIDKINKEIKR